MAGACARRAGDPYYVICMQMNFREGAVKIVRIYQSSGPANLVALLPVSRRVPRPLFQNKKRGNHAQDNHLRLLGL
jgi:hypothetical protein